MTTDKVYEFTLTLNHKQYLELKRQDAFYDASYEEWIEKFMIAISAVYAMPIEGEHTFPKFHWLVWVNRKDAKDAHVERKSVKWKRKIKTYKIISQHYREEDAHKALAEHLASLE